MQDSKEIKETKNENNKKQHLFHCSCDICGKHFLSTDFFQSICKDCIDEFVEFANANFIYD